MKPASLLTAADCWLWACQCSGKDHTTIAYRCFHMNKRSVDIYDRQECQIGTITIPWEHFIDHYDDPFTASDDRQPLMIDTHPACFIDMGRLNLTTSKHANPATSCLPSWVKVTGLKKMPINANKMEEFLWSKMIAITLCTVFSLLPQNTAMGHVNGAVKGVKKYIIIYTFQLFFHWEASSEKKQENELPSGERNFIKYFFTSGKGP